MKITKAEGYKKPNYAVAVAATMTVLTMTGCGSGSALEGAATLATPPEQEVQLGGEATLANPVIDYDGGLEMYTDPDYIDEGEEVVQLDGDVAEFPYEDDDENTESDGTEEDDENKDSEEGKEFDGAEDKDDKVYCQPDDEGLELAGSVEIYEP